MDTNTELLYELCTQLAKVQGRMRWCKDTVETAREQCLNPTIERWGLEPAAPRVIPLVRNRNRQMVVRAVPATSVRRVRYSSLKAYQPELYRRYVTEVPPDTAYIVALKAKRGASTEWNGYRGMGWAAEVSRQAALRVPPVAEWNFSTAIEHMDVIKARLATLTAEQNALRATASAWFESSGHSAAVPGRGDGWISPSVRGPAHTADVDALLTYPEAAEFINTSKRAAMTVVTFRDYEADPEGDQEPFEGD